MFYFSQGGASDCSTYMNIALNLDSWRAQLHVYGQNTVMDTFLGAGFLNPIQQVSLQLAAHYSGHLPTALMYSF